MDFEFKIGEGLFQGTSDDSRFISEFEPVFVKKICCLNQLTAEENIEYIIKVRDIHGNFGKETALKSLRNIPYFELFGCPDSMLKKGDRAILEAKLQHECAKMEPQIVPVYPPGLYSQPDNTPVFILGDYMVHPDKFETLHPNPQNPRFRIPSKPILDTSFLAAEARKYMNFFPGVSEIIFYGSLLGIIKPFLAKMQISPDFILAVIGPSGSLKTSITRMFALWLEHTQLQETNFQASQRMPAILSKIENLSGLNFLMDDLHNVYGTQAKNKQKNWLDKLTREICLDPKYANVIITGESISNMAIFSGYDRMFQVTIPKMESIKLDSLKKGMCMLQNTFMPQLAALFAQRLLADYKNVFMHIRNFLGNYNPLGFEDATVRISSHIKFLRLSEYLYRIYICGNSEDLSCKIQYEHALAQNAISQQKALLQQRNREEDINYIQAIYQCMNAKDKYIYICTSSLEYKPSANACLYENGEIFITSSALTNSLSKYLGMPVKLKDE